MMDSVQIARLEGFFHVARTGGYASAARAFPYPITQPAVHQQVSKLETELGVKLFTRTSKDRMTPTAEGRVLYEFVKPFFEGLPGVVRSVRQRTFGGTLTIHAGGLLIRKLIPDWLRRLRRSRPDITVDLHEAEDPSLTLLRQGGVDLLLDFVPSPPPDVRTTRIATTYPFAILPASRAATHGRRSTLAQLRDEVFIGYPKGSMPSELQLAVLSRYGIVPPRTVTLTSADSIVGLVEAGVGWSIIPWLDRAGPKSSLMSVRALNVPRAGFPVHVAYRKRDADNPLIAAALQAAKEK
jgi:LysR family transcriptional regulator, benzoate and cis,cis-muconate-responsive activator of ben and cat genes